MSEDSAVAALPPAAENINVVALTPAEMVPAQHDLIAWCDRKIRALMDEGDELELHQKLAIENGWKTSVVVANLNRNAKRITYYQKMKAALEAGFLLVPNMPVDVLAIRVKREKPIGKTARWQSQAERVPVESLPPGQGRYVDEAAFTRTVEVYQERDGKQVAVNHAQACDFDEVDFPVAFTKPVVLQRVGRAMALKVFDTIGLVQNGRRRGDPIYVGQIIDPRGNGRLATFFLAWWVDTSTL